MAVVALGRDRSEARSASYGYCRRPPPTIDLTAGAETGAGSVEQPAGPAGAVHRGLPGKAEGIGAVMAKGHELTSQRVGRMLTVVSSGELDSRTCEDFEEVAQDAVAAGVIDVVIDCRGLGLADATGVSTLMALRARLEARNGSRVMFGPCDAVRDALHAAGATDDFLIVEP